MIRNTAVLLKHEIAKNPKLAFAFENVVNMTVEEIETSKFPKWIRQEMIKKKNSERVFDVFGNMTIHESFTPEIDGDVRRWRGHDMFVRVDRGNQLDIKTDKILFFPYNGGVYIDTAFSKFIDPILYNTELVVSHTTKTKYILMYKDELVTKYSKQFPESCWVDSNHSNVSPARLALAQQGVKIY